MLPEMAYAQRAAVNTAGISGDLVWLNANENPQGIPEPALAAMREVLPTANRYHYQEFNAIYQAIAKSEDLTTRTDRHRLRLDRSAAYRRGRCSPRLRAR